MIEINNISKWYGPQTNKGTHPLVNPLLQKLAE
jgi:hypothetical protein